MDDEVALFAITASNAINAKWRNTQDQRLAAVRCIRWFAGVKKRGEQ